MTPDQQLIQDLREKLRQQVQATVSAAQTAQLALFRLERQQPLLDAALAWIKDSGANPQAALVREAIAYRTWLEAQS